jgi:uncharacterized membrane protein
MAEQSGDWEERLAGEGNDGLVVLPAEGVERQLAVAVYADAGSAALVLPRLMAAAEESKLVMDAAVLRKDAEGKLTIKETADVGAGAGAVAGGLLGALVGSLVRRPGLGAGLGALVGGVGARLFDTGVPDDKLRQIGEALLPGTSAVAALTDAAGLEKAEALLRAEGGRLSVELLNVKPARLLIADTGDEQLDELKRRAEQALGGAAAASTKFVARATNEAGRAARKAQQSVEEAAASEKGEATADTQI